ncbi:unnamed protein product [Rotaria sp. Silwood1]|nr:unnamed protein product [Rotaria sp. Silwood1]CAF3500582.1 unnamed protein product [Rotaria sp. Silwood1]CAF3603905.1 unnamed protein product [Rotaria sp. Silwood1]CAF4614002.1 unnamed protein product [Rotaria sp. Silwood1]CAF4917923.1 unnamed protein product [Rotaria sp. Silwood1]
MVLFYRLFIVFYCIGYCLTQFSSSNHHCLDGPNFWCLNDTTESLCNFTNKTIGLCGYSNKRCQIKTGDSFCKSSPPAQEQSPFEFNGGLTGVDDNLFSYYILDLYWPPSNCPSIYNETIDFLSYFCSSYTDINQPGSERLVLHGLWPTFLTNGNYQGWPQFCSSTKNDWSKCHIDGNLCPWINSTKENFTQVDYEYCLSIENKQECLINATNILLPEQERLKILAPGYLGVRNLFINHEWTKHGSCCSLIFGHNISYYLAYMLNLVDMATRPGSLTYEYIQRNVGQKVNLNYLVTALNQTAIINCNSKCELEEIAICMNRDHHTNLPKRFITCPLGARNTSDSCKKAQCEYIFIPLRNQYRQKSSINIYYFPVTWTILLYIIFLLILFKYLILVFGACYQFQ